MLKLISGALLFIGVATCVSAEGAKAVLADELDSLIKAGEKDLFVEFYAPWCGHCKELAPKWDWLGNKFNTDDNQVIVLKVDNDENKGKMSKYGIAGFPTVKLFKKGGGGDGIAYQGIREPKQLTQFLNKHLGTKYDTLDYVAPKAAERVLSGATKKLYEAFDLVNGFKFTQAKATLEEVVASDDARSAKAADKVLKKIKTVGASVKSITATDWLQVDPDTYMPPTLDAKDVLTLFFRLDFRSTSRNTLEPKVDEFYQLQKQGLPIQVVRLTGTDVEIPDDIEYPVAVCTDSGLDTDNDYIEESMSGIQSAVIVRNNKVLYHGHCGILSEVLLETVKQILDGADPASFDVESSCGAPTEEGDGLCTAP